MPSDAPQTPRHRRPVNPAGCWRFRCPEGHASIRWASAETVGCPSCYDGAEWPTFEPEEIEDRRTGGTLAEAVAAPEVARG